MIKLSYTFLLINLDLIAVSLIENCCLLAIFIISDAVLYPILGINAVIVTVELLTFFLHISSFTEISEIYYLL